MIIKQREKSKALKVLEILAMRSELSAEDRTNLQKRIKGYEGEVMFDQLTVDFVTEAFVINDYTFKINGHTCQIDTLMITERGIEIYEIKNYEGLYRYCNGQFSLLSSNLELLDPLVQANRAAILMKQLMMQLKINCTCESFAVFMNPNCTIYQDQPNNRLLLPSSFSYHFKKRKQFSRRSSIEAAMIAEKLMRNKREAVFYGELPAYTLETLNKGIYCQHCSSSISELTGRMCICKSCQYKEAAMDNAVRHILEKQLLFPELPLETRACSDWCGDIHSMYRIRSALKKIEKNNLA